MEKFKLVCRKCNSENIDMQLYFKSKRLITKIICNDCDNIEDNE